MTLRGDRATVKSLPNDAPLMEKYRKSPLREPRKGDFLELIARFELATSSLPRNHYKKYSTFAVGKQSVAFCWLPRICFVTPNGLENASNFKMKINENYFSLFFILN